jgi:26S proteasome regulatory subunit T2
MERIKDYLLMEEEFIRNQERLKPQEERNEEERLVLTITFVNMI